MFYEKVELFSKGKNESKGIFVIAGVKKVRFHSTVYCLKNKFGIEIWVPLQKLNAVSGSSTAALNLPRLSYTL
jgi:hypothetical protein